MNTISAAELDRIFDEGKEDVLQYFDLSSIKAVSDSLKVEEEPFGKNVSTPHAIRAVRHSAKKPLIA